MLASSSFFFFFFLSFLNLGSFSYTSHAGYFFIFFNLGSFSYTSYAGFVFMWGVSLTHPVLASSSFFLFYLGRFSWEILLRTPCWLYFCLGSFSYTSCAGFISYASHAGFIFYVGSFSYTSCAVFFSLFFYLGSFSYTSRVGFISVWGLSLTRPGLASFLSGEFLLHITC